ncbi:Receptor-type guanylate cyclase gcy-22 [Physocladia obscura]|uniref:Receptor-type guanylate cyclase gcy-22 n=1 Tax=Physocladia obscura TaxID=109957 RepID=A0AAD5T151_9FUNG|nr:Receptor-type guanylate cyclase gcy-22 [Physocladia obscura]
MSKTQSLIDQETLDYLENQRKDDNKIVNNIETEHEDIEFIFEHAERYNNWKTDELYLERSVLAEASFLEKIHDDEQENLKKRQLEEAASQKSIEEDQRTFNFIINEMKSLKQFLARVEARQERERKALAESHARKLKKMNLSRNVTLRDVEDPEIRIILKGLEFTHKTSCEENLRTEALKAKEAKIHHSKVLAQLVRNQKEIEQMREIHLLQQKYISRYLDCELEIIDENEALLSEHTAKEQSLEDHLKQQADVEENMIDMKLMALQSTQNERNVNQLAASVRERQRKETKYMGFKESVQAKIREKEFWLKEIEILKTHLTKLDLPIDGPQYETKRDELLNRIPKDLHESIEEASLDQDEEDGTTPVVDDINVEAARAREMALFETLKKAHKQAVKKHKQQNSKIREARRAEQQKILASILIAQDSDIKKLKNQQQIEMLQFEETQKSASKADEDNAASNERLYGMLPKFVADVMKTGAAVEPRPFKCLAFLTADIVSFTNLSSKSSAKQVVSLLNRLYSQMDEVIDSFEDLYKLETIGDAYNVVAGLNTQEKSTPKDFAVSMIECAQRFIDIVRNLDMSDQITDHIQMRIGVHVGPAVGGVANPAMPKYSLFGDTVTITGQMEQTSRPMEIHISGPAYDLVTDVFNCEVSEAVPILDGKQKMPAWWLISKKTFGVRESQQAEQ